MKCSERCLERCCSFVASIGALLTTGEAYVTTEADVTDGVLETDA